MNKSTLTCNRTNYYLRAFLVGFLFGIFAWLIEGLLQKLFLTPGSYSENIFPHNVNQFWMHVFTLVLFIVFSLIIAYFFKAKINLTNEARLSHAALNNIHESILITDSNNKIVYTNRWYEEISGYSEHEVFGKNSSILSSGKQNGAFYEKLWHSLNNTGHWEGEVWNRRKSGELFPEWFDISAIKDSAGKVTNYVGVFTDITSQREFEEKIKYYAFYDPLTKLPNKRFFLERLEQAIKTSKRDNQWLAVLFIGLDHFNKINDEHGHLAGDKFLYEVSRKLRESVREVDTVSRFSADEFVILLQNVRSKTSAVKVSEKIWAFLNESTVQLEEGDHSIQASIGGSVYPEDAQTPESLVKLAYEAMSEVKSTTRNASKFK